MSDRLVTFREAGVIIGGVCTKTIRRMIARGELPVPVRRGRTPVFFYSDIEGYLVRLKEQYRREA